MVDFPAMSLYKAVKTESIFMAPKGSDDENIDISLITQAAVGYVRDHADSKRMAEHFVQKVRVHLGQIFSTMDGDKFAKGKKEHSESMALMEYVNEKVERLESEKGYTTAQASAIVLKDDLVPLQVVAGMANDPEMIASVRKVNAHVINELGNLDTPGVDPRTLLKRKKRGRAPGSGKKKPENS